MRSNKLISALMAAYDWIHPDVFLKINSFRHVYIWAYFQYKKTFEDPFLNLARRYPQLFHNGDILDVGANVGYTACVFAQAVKKGSKVFAFEPDLFTYDLLREVVQRKSSVGSVETINTAVGDFDGELEFWHNNKHPADHRVATDRFQALGPKDAKFTTIPVIKIDTFVENRGLRDISFIKIDVQGYEQAVCEGMTGTLERFPNLCVCLEYCPEALMSLGFEGNKLLTFFRNRGYTAYALTQGDLRVIPDQDSIQLELNDISYVDLLFTKSALT